MNIGPFKANQIGADKPLLSCAVLFICSLFVHIGSSFFPWKRQWATGRVEWPVKQLNLWLAPLKCPITDEMKAFNGSCNNFNMCSGQLKDAEWCIYRVTDCNSCFCQHALALYKIKHACMYFSPNRKHHIRGTGQRQLCTQDMSTSFSIDILWDRQPSFHIWREYAGADPGFLERGFVCIKVWGFAFLILSQFS